MIGRTSLRILLLLTIVGFSYCKPPITEEHDGPCIGMDCLHGVLMHNDEEQSGDHKAEDQYLRFKEVLDTEKPMAGPLEAEKEFHGALMHGDNEAGAHHVERAEILPEIQGEAGPKDLNEYLHEAMHGEEGVRKHAWDEDDDAKEPTQQGPEGDKIMHGMLMHGDADHVHDALPAVDDEAEGVKKGPIEGGDLMHGLLMHGDADHVHDAVPAVDEEAEGVKKGPIEGGDLMHGLLMHGDATGSHDHGDQSGADSGSEDGTMKGPNGDLHGLLMHGDTEMGHDHSTDHAKDTAEPFSDITKILEMELEAELLNIIDMEAILAQLEKDKKEYEDYVKNQPEGSTLASVSDSPWSDMDLMKQKYLAGANVDTADDEGTAYTKDLPFTAEDARGVLGDDDVLAEDGEDMRHNLELLGSTEPINARHKISLALSKARSGEKSEEY